MPKFKVEIYTTGQFLAVTMTNVVHFKDTDSLYQSLSAKFSKEFTILVTNDKQSIMLRSSDIVRVVVTEE